VALPARGATAGSRGAARRTAPAAGLSLPGAVACGRTTGPLIPLAGAARRAWSVVGRASRGELVSPAPGRTAWACPVAGSVVALREAGFRGLAAGVDSGTTLPPPAGEPPPNPAERETARRPSPAWPALVVGLSRLAAGIRESGRRALRAPETSAFEPWSRPRGSAERATAALSTFAEPNCSAGTTVQALARPEE
jgi:hypothetical protein